MIRRRNVLGLMGAAAGVAMVNGQARAATRAPKSLDLADEQQLGLVLRKLRYGLDGSLTFWWLRGTRYGVVDSFATPFWDMHIGTWYYVRDLDEDNYEVTVASANYYTPVGSAELLEVFRNPYTKAEVPVKYAAPKARRSVVGPKSGSVFGSGGMPGMKTTRATAPGPGWIEGENVVVRGDMVMSAVPEDPASGARPMHVNDWSTYVGKLADLTDPAQKNPPAMQYFTDILTWPAWLQMGDQPGSYVSRCHGRKAFAYEQMPALWRSLFEQAHPEAAKDPVGLVKPG